ncbi:SPOR domain-containing protein [Hydrogenovibrio kuenenii]|uniref:SPOR domain-containing protein n=1 Tax=Hydrogenovibrio kuenenii TaxID=63658 RepID=UPI000467C2CB|nr:SPOR domain-containing protein [Hydrogenovibrio kuenenii]
MAQTISELEKERAELLQAIENQAQTMSSSRSGEQEPQEHTLQDWLNAAEEVMPNNPKTRSSQSQQSAASRPSKDKSAKSNKASFFGVIIMLALLLTILGVLYIAYTSIHNELKTVMATKGGAVKEIKELKASVEKLQTDAAANGKGKLFEDLQNRVAALEKEVKALKAQRANLSVVGASQLPNNVVTTEVLDSKLKEYTKGIDAKLEKILKHLNLTMDAATATTPKPAAKAETQSKVTVSKEEPDEQIAEPKAPNVKPMDQPLVRLVQKAPAPTKPSAPTKPESPKPAKAPLKDYTQGVKWLMSQPAYNYTLQLASMSDRASVQKMVDSKNLHGTKIIPQERGGEVNYVLVSGSYKTRQQAENAATTYKSKLQISPWIRKIKDLSSRVK